METTTDEKRITLTWKTVVPVVISLLFFSNIVTGLIFNQEQNTEQIAYDNEKTTRKLKNQLKATEQLIYISELNMRIIRLEEHLKECEK